MKELKNKNFIKKEYIENSILEDVLDFLDPELSEILKLIPIEIKSEIEEIRIRINKPLMISLKGKDFFINNKGCIIDTNKESHIVSHENIIKTFRLLSNYSVYAFEEELRNGYITIKGGHRVGVAGRVVYGKNGIDTIKDISSLNIRIAQEKIDTSRKVLKYLINEEKNTIYHTLLVSPPKCGKTTLLRDIIRSFSNGIKEYGFRGLKVGVVDERSEIAGIFRGMPQKDIGIRTDVLDGCPKHEGIILLIRAMSPDIIATDEIGGDKDIKALHEALKSGVKILATVHGESLDDLRTRPNLKQIIEENIFQRIIIMDNSKGTGTIRDIIDGNTFKTIFGEEEKNDVSIKNIRKFYDHSILHPNGI